MTLTQLRYFLGIATTGTMSGAARQIGIAQPALSLQIAHLEAELGQALFVRHGRGMSLTEAGQRLKGRAVEILRQVELTKDELSADAESPSGTVVVGMATAANMAFSVELLISARRRFPRLKVHLVESMSGFLLEWVERGRIDLAVVYDVTPHAALSVERLATESLYLISAPGADAATRSMVRFADLGGYPLIVPGKQHRLGQLLDQLAATHNITLDIVAEVDSTHTIKKLVSRGEGYSILSAHAVQEEIKCGALSAIPIEAPAITRSIDLITNPLRRLNPSVAIIAKLIAQLVRVGPERMDASGGRA